MSNFMCKYVSRRFYSFKNLNDFGFRGCQALIMPRVRTLRADFIASSHEILPNLLRKRIECFLHLCLKCATCAEATDNSFRLAITAGPPFSPFPAWMFFFVPRVRLRNDRFPDLFDCFAILWRCLLEIRLQLRLHLSDPVVASKAIKEVGKS